MKLHANAALSPKGRQLLIDRIERESQSVRDVAESLGISERTARKWLARWRAEGPAGLTDRSSAPRTVANRTDQQTVALLIALRRLRFTAPQLADLLDLPCSTISGVLKREGMGKLGRIGQEPVVRYERARPGELIHIDVKKLGRITGGAGKRVTPPLAAASTRKNNGVRCRRAAGTRSRGRKRPRRPTRIPDRCWKRPRRRSQRDRASCVPRNRTADTDASEPGTPRARSCARSRPA